MMSISAAAATGAASNINAKSKDICKAKSSRQLLINYMWRNREAKYLSIRPVSLVSVEPALSSTLIISDPKEILLRTFEEQSNKLLSIMQPAASASVSPVLTPEVSTNESTQTNENNVEHNTQLVMIGTPSDQNEED